LQIPANTAGTDGTGVAAGPADPEQPAAAPVTPSGTLEDLIGQTEEEKPLKNMTRFEGWSWGQNANWIG
jgi:hypothetical protein